MAVLSSSLEVCGQPLESLVKSVKEKERRRRRKD